MGIGIPSNPPKSQFVSRLLTCSFETPAPPAWINSVQTADHR